MKMTIVSTAKIVQLDGIPARVWEGVTERGVAVTAFITRVAVPEAVPEREKARFALELQEHTPPSAEAAQWPARMFLGD